MRTNIEYNGGKTNVFISHETARKDFVLWAGFTLVGVYKSLDDAKAEVTSNTDIDATLVAFVTT